MILEPYKIIKDKSLKIRRVGLKEMQSIQKPEKKYHVLICPCHSAFSKYKFWKSKDLKKLKRRENKRLPVYNLKNYAFREANNVNHLIRGDPLIKNEMINPFVSDDDRKIDDDWAENSKGDRVGLFDYIRTQHGDEYLEKLKNNLKDRGIELHPTEKKKPKMPEYDRKKDEKDALLKYKKWQTNKPLENFQTDIITKDSNYESTSSDVDENSSGLKMTEKLKPAGNSSKKAGLNESVADSINRRIDKEILPALAAISKQLTELKEKEGNRSVEGKNINQEKNANAEKNANPEGEVCCNLPPIEPPLYATVPSSPFSSKLNLVPHPKRR